MSSTAALDVFQFGVGYAENSDLPFGSFTSFDGQTVGSSTVLIKYTRNGDADLNGTVDDADVGTFITYYTDQHAAWGYADWDYDGTLDDDESGVLATFYDPGATPMTEEGGGVRIMGMVYDTFITWFASQTSQQAADAFAAAWASRP
jgi:hypothetical protein